MVEFFDPLMSSTFEKSDREDNDSKCWQIDTSQFVEGPDNWNSNLREGWKLYLVEDLPERDVYALCKYTWRTDRNDVLVDIGSINVEPMIELEEINNSLSEEGVSPLSKGQFKTLKHAYRDCISETIRNATLDKGYEICDHTVYFGLEDWDEYLHQKVGSVNQRIERITGNSDEESYAKYHSEEEVEYYESLEMLNDAQLENIKLIKSGVNRPHTEGMKYANHCQFVGRIKFETLDKYKLRALELVHNGVFHNHSSVAIVQALREEGYSQKDIAKKLEKDISTVSKQVSVADNLTKRSRWHSTNVGLNN
jgi:hypothetical protein